MYHYFPGGKEQIGVEALARSGERIRRTIATGPATPPTSLPRSTTTSCSTPSACATPTTQRGCPIATVALETAERQRAHPQGVRRRVPQLADHAGRGVRRRRASPRPTPSPLATFVLSSYEGALTMSRALRDIQPMLTSGAAVASVLHAHLGDAPRAG